MVIEIYHQLHASSMYTDIVANRTRYKNKVHQPNGYEYLPTGGSRQQQSG